MEVRLPGEGPDRHQIERQHAALDSPSEMRLRRDFGTAGLVRRIAAIAHLLAVSAG